MGIWGVDCSNHQGGDIDWQTASRAGIRFGWCKVAEGAGYRDPFWAGNRDRALAAGISMGGYHYARPGSDAATQAEFFLRLHGPMRKGMLPPALDLEESDGTSSSHIHDWSRRWMDIVEAKLGVVPVLYTYPYFWANAAGCPDGCCAKYPLWFASYTSQQPGAPNPWRSAGKGITVWQYSGTGTYVPGIGAGQDANWFVGTEAELRALAYGAAPAPLHEENDEMGFVLQSDLGFLHCVGGRLVDVPIDVVGQLNAAGAHTIQVSVEVFANYQAKLDHPLAA